MTLPAEKQDARLMRDMFGEVAPRYDFVTRVFSYGMDRHWKRLGVRKVALPDKAVVLDLASGTGDFSKLVLHRLPQARSIAMDITEPMLQLARERGLTEVVCGDALKLPFPDDSFDCVFIGYGLRNFPDLRDALQEIERVTRSGGLFVSLDFFLPANRVLRQLYLAYLYVQGAIWGFLLHGRPRVYTYIPDSLRSFVSMKEFSGLLTAAGYVLVDARAYIFGGIGLHWAAKRQSPIPDTLPERAKRSTELPTARQS
jgi:demethylmenaquinone methyltransferase / 2-methoxy-6-polyprenyl-1,4-benzoquinol methylase